MPQILEPNYDIREPTPNRIRWTRQQCLTLVDAGILTDRYELIDGEIISKMGQGSLHAYVITRLTEMLRIIFGAEYVRFQLPIRVPGPDDNFNEPEPDAAVLSRASFHFQQNTPGAEEVVLTVEVSDSSLAYDTTTKAALYARAGIADYWIIDIVNRQVLIHRKPSDVGYAEIVAYKEDEMVVTLARPDAQIRVSDLLPTV